MIAGVNSYSFNNRKQNRQATLPMRRLIAPRQEISDNFVNKTQKDKEINFKSSKREILKQMLLARSPFDAIEWALRFPYWESKYSGHENMVLNLKTVDTLLEFLGEKRRNFEECSKEEKKQICSLEAAIEEYLKIMENKGKTNWFFTPMGIIPVKKDI